MSAQYRCMVCGTHTIGSEIILTHSMVPVGDEAQVEGRFGPFGGSANLDADRCMVCAKRTIGSKIIVDAPDGTPR